MRPPSLRCYRGVLGRLSWMVTSSSGLGITYGPARGTCTPVPLQGPALLPTKSREVGF